MLYVRYNLYESLVDIYILLQKVMSSMSKRLEENILLYNLLCKNY